MRASVRLVCSALDADRASGRGDAIRKLLYRALLHVDGVLVGKCS